MDEHREYLRVFTAVSLTLFVAIATFNLAIDPFSIYYGLTSLRPYKEEHKSRTAKAELLRQADCRTVIFGTSRAEVIRPESKLLSKRKKGRGVCNAALLGASMVEVHNVFHYARANNTMKRAIVFTDFIQFSSIRDMVADWKVSRFNPERDVIDYHLDHVLGFRATRASSVVLDRWWWRRPSPWKIRGNRVGTPKVRPTRSMFEGNVREYLTHPVRYTTFDYDAERVELVRDIVRTSREDGIELVFAIAPIHAVQLETIRFAGLGPAFEQWKRDMVAAVHEAGEGEVPLWDFSVYTTYTMEAVPPHGEVDGMEWYWESSHLKAQLGDEVLRRVYGKEKAAFGTIVTPDNIDAVLEQGRADRRDWKKRYPADARMVRDVASRIRWTRRVRHRVEKHVKKYKKRG